MAYYLKVNSLENCPFSLEIEDIFKNKKFHYIIHKIKRSEKELYKNDDIKTFPQIYLEKYNSKGSILLGGNSDIKEIINNNHKSLEDQINILNKKYKHINNKTKLRIIELFIKK